MFIRHPALPVRFPSFTCQKNIKPSSDHLTAYKFRPNVSIPSHAESADPSKLLENLNGLPFEQSSQGTVMPIDLVHKQKLPHTGVWIFICDNQRRVLLTKRAPDMVTCPNSWTLLGEHSSVGEELDPEATVFRGMQEEIGSFLNHTLVAHSGNLMPDKMPMYFTHDYGPKLEHRTDRQFTYFWYVELRISGEEVLRRKETGAMDENSKMRWISTTELEALLFQRPKDFCHGSVRAFFKLGVAQLKLFQESRFVSFGS